MFDVTLSNIVPIVASVAVAAVVIWGWSAYDKRHKPDEKNKYHY